ncbi:MAG: hypothetical protein ACOZAM_15220 [Pseudomonadota bacterium]
MTRIAIICLGPLPMVATLLALDMDLAAGAIGYAIGAAAMGALVWVK